VFKILWMRVAFYRIKTMQQEKKYFLTNCRVVGLALQ
jgi:hypothetical protein